MKSYKRHVFLLLTCALIAQSTNIAFAEYEVVKAKTVENENLVETQKDEYAPTFNDMDLDDYEKIDNSNTLMSKLEKKFHSFMQKKSKKDDFVLEEEDVVDEELLEDEETQEKKEDKIAKHPIKQPQQEEVKIDDKNTFQINADEVTYNDNDGNVYAKGNVEIISKSQGVTLKADEAILDKDTQTLKLQNNVKIIKSGVEMFGEYLLVDLNEENILMDNPTLEAYSFRINAQEGYLIANDIQMLNGVVKCTKETEYPFQTRGFMRLNSIPNNYLAQRQKNQYTNYVAGEKTQAYEINAKEIVLTSYKDHNSITLKDADIYFNKKKIIRNSDIEILSDKENQIHEVSFPEAGTLRSFGTYVGYGIVNRLPKGHTLKLMPAIVYGESNLGVGIIGRHRTQNNILEAGWATSTENLVVRGRYNAGKGFRFNYGRNAYIPEGFMGARRSGYAAQLEWKKSYKVEDLDLFFNQGVYAGIFSDYKKHNQSDAYATTRFRYTAEIRKNIFQVENKEQDLMFGLNAIAQGAATVYGSGETHAVGRFGPSIVTKVKGWESSIAYMSAGIHGDSPFVFDRYRYGKSTIQLNEKFELIKKDEEKTVLANEELKKSN